MAIKDLLKQIQREDDLAMAIDQYYEFYAQHQRDDSRAFHPSGAGECHMKIAYSYLGYDRPKFTAATMKKMDNGTWMHKRYSHLFEQMSKTMNNFYLVESEIPIEIVKYGMIIKGHADFIIELNAKKLLIELKSIRSEMFYKLDGPSSDYVTQWMIYSDCLEIYEGRMLYENKNDQELKQYKMLWNKDMVKEAYDKLSDIYFHVSEGNLPPRPKGIGIECTRWGGCNWFDHCWKGESDGRGTMDPR